MKTIDYINTLIKEKESLTALCKSHVETINLIKKEMKQLKDTILKKDKKIVKLESEIEPSNEKMKKELKDIKNELSKLRESYDDLLNKYNAAVEENTEFKRIFDEIENMCDEQ